MKEISNIGIFDSGVGGLSVLKSIKEGLRFDNVIYYGDNARVPYGNKSKEVIVKFSLDALDFFNQFDIDLLVVACNTVSAYSLKQMQEKINQIQMHQNKSNIPIVGVIESGILATTKKSNLDDLILIAATNATIKSGLYESTLRSLGYRNVISVGANLLVGLVEEDIYQGRLVQECLKYYFDKIKSDYKVDSVILGCTHFPLLLDSFKEYFGECKFIHSGDAIVEYLRDNFLLKNDGENNISFYASGDIKALKNTAKLWL